MSMMEPLVPHHRDDADKGIAAADPGTGAPEVAEGFGVLGEEPGDPEAGDDGRPTTPTTPRE